MSSFKPANAGPKKKLVIKPFKSAPQLPSDFEQVTWNKLKTALEAISNKTSTSISKEELCQAVEDACRHRLGASIYAKLSEYCRKHIESKVDSLKEFVSSKCSESLNKSILVIMNIYML